MLFDKASHKATFIKTAIFNFLRLSPLLSPGRGFIKIAGMKNT